MSDELQDEILETPAVTLVPAVDGIVGVQFRIPVSTLVGCLLVMLRTGGSGRMLRRL